MKIYKVGGAVRDELLGFKPRDLDFLVIDSSPEEMKKKGFIQVGSSYEVFLHPETKDEYVLATDLRMDLARRDLTINSMAIDQEGHLLDFFNGKDDLEKKILRHTSSYFSDDPLRIYRVARFKAQYPDFKVADETLALCRSIAKEANFRTLNGERILGEFKDALSAKAPEEFFDTLKLIGALNVHLDCIRDWKGLNQLATKGTGPLQMFSFLMRTNTREEIDHLSARLLIQNDWIEAAKVTSRFKSLPPAENMKAEDYIEFFYAMDAFRKPHLINLLSDGVMERYFSVVNQISMKDVVPGTAGKEIGDAIRKIRTKKLEETLKGF